MQFTRSDRRKSRWQESTDGLRRDETPPVLDQAPGAPDLWLLLILGALVSSGLIMMYSTTLAEATQEGMRDLLKLGGGLVAGIVLMVTMHRLPIRYLRKMTPLLLTGCFVALTILLTVDNPSLVRTANGASRWFWLPGGFTIQPSEFAKLGFVLFAAHFLDRFSQQMNRNEGRPWLTFLGVLGLLCVLIYKEPDLGTALVVAGTAFCMLLAAGIDWKKLTGGVVLMAALVLLVAWNTDHQRARLQAWWNPWAKEHYMEGGYQVIRSWMAMVRGGWTGVGLGRSTQKLQNRLPESETDFIFAIVAEEMGLIRASGVLLLFGLFIWRGYSIAARAPDRYGSLLVTGITSWVAVQSCLNIAVVTGTLPNTGVPLPFISSGLSSLTALMAGTGIILGISRRLPTSPALLTRR